MKIVSAAFKNNTKIPRKFTCEGENVNPPLEFIDVPQSAKSLALIMDDPDAPMGLWVHWILFNISPSTKTILENSFPKEALQGKNTRGTNVYRGPCPPDRMHRYFFKLYALDVVLDLDSNIDKSLLESEMVDHIIEKAELVGLYDKVSKS